jgi:hypothetical protein
LPTRLTDAKFIEIQLGFGLQALQNGLFFHRPQQAVAAQAARPGSYFIMKLEAVENGRSP